MKTLQQLQTRDAYLTRDLLEVKFSQWIRNYDAYKHADKRKKFLQKLKDDPVFFALKIMGFKVFKYQERLLRTKSKRIVAVWGRQSGKTTTISIKVIHFAYTHPNVTVLIVSKGLRQSMIMFSVVTNFILGNALLRPSVARYTRTQFHLKNGSKIIALPCSQDGANLRGHTADMVIMDEAAYQYEILRIGRNHARNCDKQRHFSHACYNRWNRYYGVNSLGTQPHLLPQLHKPAILGSTGKKRRMSNNQKELPK